jgi:hypothetical protein
VSAKRISIPPNWPYVRVGNMKWVGFVGPGNDELVRLDKATLRFLLDDPHPHRWRSRLEKKVRWLESSDPGKQAFARAILLSLALQGEAASVMNHPPGLRRRIIERINNYWSLHISGRTRGRRDEDREKRIAFMTVVDEASKASDDLATQVEHVRRGWEKLNFRARDELDLDLLRKALTLWPHTGGRYKGEKPKERGRGSPKWNAMSAVMELFLPKVLGPTLRADWAKRRDPSHGAATVSDR